MADVNELVGGRDGGIVPESSKVELETKVCKKNSSLAGEVMAILSS